MDEKTIVYTPEPPKGGFLIDDRGLEPYKKREENGNNRKVPGKSGPKTK